MAQVRLNGTPYYQQYEVPMTTVTEKVQTGTQPEFTFFGIPFGSKPVYENQTKQVEERTATSPYGVNSTGRTLPFAPIPTSSDYFSVYGDAAPPNWARGGNQSTTSGQSGLFGNSPLGGILSQLFGFNQPQQQGPYEPALRERPRDIQNLVSMSQRPGFGG